MRRFELAVPGSVDECLQILAKRGPDTKVVAGGTDLLPQLKNGVLKPGWVVDLSAVAEDALELAAPGIAGLDLTVESDLGPAETTGDQQLIERMVWNLVDNAVRHNEPGGWIRITTGRTPGGAVLHIANSGAVVPPGAVPTLAEPFRRIRKVSDGGVGLGLSIAQSVSTAHGAQLDVRSRPEGGLDISLTLRG